MRFIRELLKPKMKCDRVGHIPVERSYNVIAKTDSWHAVADTAKMSRTECKRCRAVLSDPEFSKRSGITSLSMPRSQMEKLERDGFVITTS